MRRTINGVERRFLERMASAKWSDLKDSCYLDCAMMIRLTEPTRVISGIWHLEGETVDALADGFSVRGVKVINGSIDLGFEAEGWVTVGLPYESVIETMPVMPQAAGKRQQSGQAVIEVVRTRGLEVGRKLSAMYAPKPRRGEALGDANDLKTGAYEAETKPMLAGETTLFLRSAEPLPMTVTAVYLDAEVTER